MQGMQMDEGDARLLKPVTERVIGCAFRVADALGHGFVAKVSEMPMAARCERAGRTPSGSGDRRRLRGRDRWRITADLPVEDQIIVEPKVVSALIDVHIPQCRNYMRATGKPLCLLINFGRPQVGIHRVTGQA
jgi:GxxExxY protein